MNKKTEENCLMFILLPAGTTCLYQAFDYRGRRSNPPPCPNHTGTLDFTVDGETFQTVFKVFGDLKSGHRPLVALHGGPGIPHQYLLPISELVLSRGIPIVFYDQLGCGLSTHLPHKPKEFWTVELFTAELDNLLVQLCIAGDFDLNPKGLKHLIISDSPASLELWKVANNMLLAAFPEPFREMVKKNEAAGTTDSQEYQQGMEEFNEKFTCTVKPWPETFTEDPTVYSGMIGPSELNITGRLKNFTLVDDLHKISVPTLLISGKYNQAQDIAVLPFFRKIPKVKWIQFAQNSHTPIFEEKERYLEVVGYFLTT
ncbi:proline-specific peptidase [Mycena epipterygia]|nr:proline-specific peptidase [Mycena epipterygia]